MRAMAFGLLAATLLACSKGDIGGADPPSGGDAGPSGGDGAVDEDAGVALVATDDDLACFDSYCPHRSLAHVAVQTVAQAGTDAYRHALRTRLLDAGGYLSRIRDIDDSDRKYHSTDEWNYYNRVADKHDWESQLITSYVALSCARAFEERAKVGDPPNASTLDWTTLPGCRDAGAWLEKVYDAWFAVQHMTHEPQPASGGFVPKEWDGYGVWPDNGEFNPVRQWFSGSAWFYPIARYTHLVSKEFAERARTHTMAALCGLRVGSSNVGTYDFESATAASTGAQWLLQVNSWVQMTTTLLRLEQTLGVEAASTDCANGTFSSKDALATTETLTKNTRAYVERYGQTEYQSSYGHVILDSLVQMATTPSSQKVHDDAVAIYRAAMWDVAANFSPSVGTPTGPGNRNHDLFLGSHGAWMNFEIPLYVQPFFHPYCDALGSCVGGGDPVPPVSAPSALPYFRTLFALWQVAGYGPSPYADVRALTVDRPYRTNFENAGREAGKDRQQFIAPTYSLGHAGDDTNLLAINYHLTARLGGAPNASQPATPDLVSHSSEPDTFVTGEIRHMLVSNDDPFRTDASGFLPGLDLQITPRQVVAQYQSYMLVTHLAGPGEEGSTKYGPFDHPLSSNLLFPLAVDEIRADGALLPREKGSAVTLRDGAVITLRLHDASIVIRPLVVERVDDAYATTWQVDDSSFRIGYGKLVYTHKKATDVVNRPYHVAWLWAAGVTHDDAERQALEALVSSATVKSTLTPKGKWSTTGNVFDLATPTDLVPPGSCAWSIEVGLRDHVLRVDREDVYQPWGNDPKYSQLDATPPFQTTFSRTWDGAPTMPTDWSTADTFFASKPAIGPTPAYRSIGYSSSDYLQLHH